MNRAAIPRCVTTVLALLVMIVAGCGKKHHVARTQPAPKPPASATTARQSPGKPAPVAVPNGYMEEGIASWYGIPFNGRAAADGEIYDMETLVAAHRLMPFNTWLKVTNLSNNKSVNVRVIDRGPFVDGRIIDLSKAAAREIDLLGPGIGRVRLEVIGAPADIPANDFYAVQVGAFSVYENAERARIDYAKRFGTAQLALRQGKIQMWRVLVGKESSIQSTQQLANRLAAENREVFVVRLDETVVKSNATLVPTPAPATPAPETPANDAPPAPVPPQ
ncbi:MAG TPA: septal ring lytic transglycosylase RlpA family protein [Bryobacteraceae bacterium]|nr:septal ring lytic transglycosylase RlpA family protein [Bryobacteraceae bacterium]